jgi:hypothetical protein
MQFSGRKFVWIGVIADFGSDGSPIRRDCFEERL